jgi:metal-responsive CopG/Arc/MetJ family transcriptional regulator
VASVKIAISLKKETLDRLDAVVASARFASRSRAVEEAIESLLRELDDREYEQAVALLDPEEERALAEEGMALDAAAWPSY